MLSPCQDYDTSPFPVRLHRTDMNLKISRSGGIGRLYKLKLLGAELPRPIGSAAYKKNMGTYSIAVSVFSFVFGPNFDHYIKVG
jgi:hypothetical protein